MSQLTQSTTIAQYCKAESRAYFLDQANVDILVYNMQVQIMYIPNGRDVA